MRPYDCDAVVIGAGPAGIAAAIRLRWLKGYHAIPSSVVLVDPEPPGGLAAIGGCVLTGPGWALNAEGLLAPLLADLDALHIPRVAARATGLSRLGQALWQVHLDTGAKLLCHNVIVATGFRALHGERRFWGKGLHITYKGYAFFPELIALAAREAGGKGLVVIGNGASLDLLPMLAPWAALAGGLTLLLQGPASPPANTPGVRIRAGATTTAYLGDERIEGVRFQADGASQQEVLPCGAVFVDYHGFERTPEQWESLNHKCLPRDGAGFLAADARMATGLAGVFAAGDVTGRYASTAMALGDGVCAGFSSAVDIHRRKFGCEPSLFAYAATGPSPAVYADEATRQRPFALPAEATLRPLLPEGEAKRDRQLPPELAGPLQRGCTVAQVRAAVGDAHKADALIFTALFRRVMTLHHIAEQTHNSLCHKHKPGSHP